MIYSFQAITGIEDDWWQDDVEKNFRIKCCLQIDLIHILSH